MAAKHPRTPKPRESAPEFPADGKFQRLVELFLEVAWNEKGNYTRDRVAKALDATKARLGELKGYKE